MAKKKILKKPEVLLAKPTRYAKLKPGVKGIPWSPTEQLLNEDFLARALFECLKEEDLDSFKEILRSHLEAKVKSRSAKVFGLAERTMYESLSESGNPSLKTLAKIVKMACAA